MPEEGSYIKYVIDLVLVELSREAEEQTVNVIVLKDAGSIYVGGKVINLVRGVEQAIPLWTARKLAEKGIVKLKEDGIDTSKLSKLVFLEEGERRKLDFQKVSPYIYNMAKYEIEQLKKEIMRSMDTSRIRELDKTIDGFSRLFSIRLKKILQLIPISPPQEILAKLSEEEKAIYSILKEVVEAWRQALSIQ
ncbi:MAG: hypothetical protein QW224_06860 [Desulfurococcaceae archaeon]